MKLVIASNNKGKIREYRNHRRKFGVLTPRPVEGAPARAGRRVAGCWYSRQSDGRRTDYSKYPG